MARRIVTLLFCLVFLALAQHASSLVTSIPVLGYHELNTPSLYSVSSAVLGQQMAKLKQLGYSSITPQQYLSWLKSEPIILPAKPISITFDDNIANALPAVNIMASSVGFKYRYNVCCERIRGQSQRLEHGLGPGRFSPVQGMVAASPATPALLVTTQLLVNIAPYFMAAATQVRAPKHTKLVCVQMLQREYLLSSLAAW